MGMDSTFWYFKGCARCSGDLIVDEGDWRCWQCGQYYYTTGASPVNAPQLMLLEQKVLELGDPYRPPCPTATAEEDRPRRGRRRGYGARAERNINSVIRAKEVSDERWWSRNGHIIEYLDQGKSVQEIARLVALGPRQIRVIRERLSDLRSAAQMADSA